MAEAEQFKEEIRRSFALVKPISTEAAAIFYPTLWEINPETKALFRNTDMEKQGVKLMKVLGVAVTMLNKMNTLVPILQKLGRRHVAYGVTPDMYPSVGQALLITLEKGLGDECTEETKKAWTWIFGVMSEICIAAANEMESPPATDEDPKDCEQPATDDKDPKDGEQPATDDKDPKDKQPATATDTEEPKGKKPVAGTEEPQGKQPAAETEEPKDKQPATDKEGSKDKAGEIEELKK